MNAMWQDTPVETFDGGAAADRSHQRWCAVFTVVTILCSLFLAYGFWKVMA